MASQRGTGTRRVWVPAAVMGAFSLVILGRLVQVQVLQHAEYAEAADAEFAGSNTFYARRGAILDRNGNVLAVSVDTWDIYVSTRAWRDPERAKAASETLASALDLDAGALRTNVAEAETVDVLVARDVDFEIGNEIEASRVAGVTLSPNSARVNPEGDIAASVLGFTGQDNTGLAGVEAAYNELLQGQPGKAIYERDTTGEPIPYGRYVASEPTPGSDLVLTIDRYLQKLAEDALAAGIKDHRAKGGAVIIMDPRTGELLALATSPALKYSTLDSLDLGDEQQLALLKNVAVTDLYEPGSVMKVITAAAAIDKGVVGPDTSYVDNGVIYIEDIPIKNWDDRIYGPQTMTGVLQNSINTGAVFMASKLGATAFQSYLDAFGLSSDTGIELPGEATPIFRRPTDKDWSPVDLATQAFGQSISVTPVQMTAAIAAAINGGNVVKPHIVKSVVDADGHRTTVEPEVAGHAISAQTSATMRMMMNKVVEPGYRHPGAPRLYSAGGKSGTANVPVGGSYNDRQIASFVGFAPLDDPQIVILVKLDENADGMTGTEAAAPIFARLTDQVLTYLGVAPDRGTR